MKSIKDLYQIKTNNNLSEKDIYPHKSLKEIREYNLINSLSIFDYVIKYEENIEEYLNLVIDEMLTLIKNGLSKDNEERLAKEIMFQSSQLSDKYEAETISLIAYAFAASEEYEEDTKKEIIIISSLIYYYYYQKDYTKQSLIEALCLAGIFANIVKENNPREDLYLLMGTIFIAYLNDASVSLLEYTAISALKAKSNYEESNSLSLLKCFDIERLSRTLHKLETDKLTLDEHVRIN